MSKPRLDYDTARLFLELYMGNGIGNANEAVQRAVDAVNDTLDVIDCENVVSYNEKHFPVGTRVRVNGEINRVGYVQKRKGYAALPVGSRGKVVRHAATGKIGVEFDHEVFFKAKDRLSSHDNGCHGAGKMHHCWYLPAECLTAEPKLVTNMPIQAIVLEVNLHRMERNASENLLLITPRT